MHTRNNFRLATLALTAAAVSWQLGSTAFGDEIETTTRTGIGRYGVPVSDTTIREKVTDAPGAPERVINQHTVYTRLSPADASQTIIETESSDSVKYGRENYGERLRDFRSQLDKAIEKSWVTQKQADDLNSKFSNLIAEEKALRRNHYQKGECNSFEQNLNEFNIQMSHAMSGAKTK
jgi:hypothetical protein